MYVCAPYTCLGLDEGIRFPGTGITGSRATVYALPIKPRSFTRTMSPLYFPGECKYPPCPSTNNKAKGFQVQGLYMLLRKEGEK